MAPTDRDAGPPRRIATLGAALSANKGAASMLWGVLDSLPGAVGPCRVAVLSTYPDEDVYALEHDDAHVVAARPRDIVVPMLPEALLAWVARRSGADPRTVCRSPAMREIAEAEIVLDLAGISFADGRGIPTLAYNVLMSGIPVLVGTPVVKCSQALGPFETWLNRAAARLVLSRMAAICARGERTYRHVAALDLGVRLARAGDLAFLMQRCERADAEATALVAGAEGYVAVSPSAVVEAYCRRVGVDYVGLVAGLVRRLQEDGRDVVVLAHSYRPSARPSRMNDVPVCQAVLERSGVGADVTALLGDTSPTVLRAVIRRARTLVTSRFHAMISGLATGTPTVVVGWSHKYAEVMAHFDLDEFVLRFTDTDADALWDAFAAADERNRAIRAAIRAGLPDMTRQAQVNLEVIRDVLAAQ